MFSVFFKKKWSEAGGALPASGGASDLHRSKNDKRSEGCVGVKQRVLSLFPAPHGHAAKGNGLLMETRCEPAHAYVSTPATAAKHLGLCCQDRFVFNRR